MRHKGTTIALALACQLGLTGMACASETITYTYDVKGRLTTVHHNGGVHNNQNTSYTFDTADNRTNVTTTGHKGIIVAPTGGLALIPFTAPQL